MASTSKKLYEEIAGRIRELPIDESERELITATFASIFAKDNRRFDADLFREACRGEAAVRHVSADALVQLMIDYLVSSFGIDALPSLGSLVEVAEEAATRKLSKESLG